MMLMAPVRTNSSNPPMALGNPAAIPEKMMMDIPLPKPRSVICSPNHIKNMVPAVKDTMAVTRKTMPGSFTNPAEDSNAKAMPIDWKMAKPKVP